MCRKIRLAKSSVAFIFVTFVLSSCSPRVLVAKQTNLSFLENNTRDLSVALIITDGLKNAEWFDQKPIGTEIHNYKLGEALITNSETLLRKLFSEVVVLNNGQPLPNSAALLVTPRMVSVKQNRPLWIWQDTTINLAYEWSMRDKSDKIIWLDTISGEATTTLGSDPAGRVDLLMKDIFRKSFGAISASQEIERFRISRLSP